MSEDKDYDEVFHKDDRSKRGTDGYKKRSNAKEAAHRQFQMDKRNNQEQEIEEQEDVLQEEDSKGKKYANGKAKKVVKEQTCWVDQPEPQAKNGKKGKKK